MDLRAFYQKIRQVEASLPEQDVVVISLETADGGRAGVPVEVARAAAARMIVEGRARLATADETADFRERMAEAKRAADRLLTAGKLQVTVISDADLRALKGAAKKG
ncbi:MAG: hypothetical protein ACM336_18815 [Acidobacteriota bacterium]